MLQSGFIDQPFFLYEVLDIRICEPVLVTIVHFVTSDMDIGSRKESGYFIEHIADKTISFFFARMECEMLPASFTSPRYLRIGTADCRGMSRHIELRNHHNLAFGCIGHDLPDVVLCIELRSCFGIMPITDGSYLRQLRIFFDFNAPSRFVCQMPVEYIEMEPRHQVEVLFYFLFAEEVAAFIEHKSAPCVAWRTVNPATADFAPSVLCQLSDGLAGIKCAFLRSGINEDRIRRNFQLICFIRICCTDGRQRLRDSSSYTLSRNFVIRECTLMCLYRRRSGE